MMKQHHGSPRRPSIGVTPDWVEPTESTQHAKYEVKVAYLDAVARAGGLPFVLPYTEDRQVAEAYLDRLSALVVTGGAFDIPTELYGQQPKPGLGPLKPKRTAFEIMVLKAALHRQLPVLGVCGGMQLLNVALGGTLVQDIKTELPAAREHQQSHDRRHPQHPVEVKEGTALSACIGKGQVMVNSTHHQAVKALGEKLVVSALAPDGMIEAIELTGAAFTVGVQWHPELMIDTVPPHLGIYRTLVQKAREARR